MSESTDEQASTGTEDSSIAAILEHLPKDVSEALGHSTEPAEEVPQEEETNNEESTDPAEESESDEEEEPTDEEATNEKLKRRNAKLNAKAKEAKRMARELRDEKERLEAELAKRGEIRITPTDEDPLADLDTPEELEAKVSAAKKIRTWARQNPDGATIRENDGSERYLDRSEVAAYLARAETLLEDHAPTRREYLSARGAIMPEAKQSYPNLFKAGTQEHAILVDTLSRVPALKKLPNYEMIVGDAIAGMRLRQERASKSNGAEAPKLSTKSRIAPPVPKTGTGRPPQSSSRSRSDAFDKVIDSGNLDALTNYFATA